MVPETPGHSVNELIHVALRLQEVIESKNWEFCFIGGLAVQAWSEPRFTKDVDLTLLTGFGGEETFVDELLQHFDARREDAREFALTHRVLLLASEEGIGIDLALGALPFEEQAVRRARPVEVFPDRLLRLCTPEDLIVMKAFAGREQDWRDVRMTIVRQGVDALDWGHIGRYLPELATLKGEPEILERLAALRDRYAIGSDRPEPDDLP